jgi:large subunit ribosomal protein L10
VPITKEQKQKTVDELKEKLSQANVAILVDYKGLTVEEDAGLRKLCRDAGVEYRVVKNTLLELAAKGTGYEALVPYLKGPTAIAFGYADPVAPAKVLTNFINTSKKISLKAGVLGGSRLMMPPDIEALAKLPSKEVLVARLMGQLNAPVSGLVNVLQGTIRKFVYALDAIKDSKAA